MEDYYKTIYKLMTRWPRCVSMAHVKYVLDNSILYTHKLIIYERKISDLDYSLW